MPQRNEPDPSSLAPRTTYPTPLNLSLKNGSTSLHNPDHDLTLFSQQQSYVP